MTLPAPNSMNGTLVGFRHYLSYYVSDCLPVLVMEPYRWKPVLELKLFENVGIKTKSKPLLKRFSNRNRNRIQYFQAEFFRLLWVVLVAKFQYKMVSNRSNEFFIVNFCIYIDHWYSEIWIYVVLKFHTFRKSYFFSACFLTLLKQLIYICFFFIFSAQCIFIGIKKTRYLCTKNQKQNHRQRTILSDVIIYLLIKLGFIRFYWMALLFWLRLRNFF